MKQQPYVGMQILIIPTDETSTLIRPGHVRFDPVPGIVTAVNGTAVNAIAFPDCNMPVVVSGLPHLDHVNEESSPFWHEMEAPPTPQVPVAEFPAV